MIYSNDKTVLSIYADLGNLSHSRGTQYKFFQPSAMWPDVHEYLGASFVMSVRPSVSMEQLGSHGTDIHEIWYCSVFRKYQENLSLINIWQE
jgi:hypothetical protein